MDWEIKIVTLCLVGFKSLHCRAGPAIPGVCLHPAPFPPTTHACQYQANTAANYDYWKQLKVWHIQWAFSPHSPFFRPAIVTLSGYLPWQLVLASIWLPFSLRFGAININKYIFNVKQLVLWQLFVFFFVFFFSSHLVFWILFSSTFFRKCTWEEYSLNSFVLITAWYLWSFLQNRKILSLLS